MSAKKTSGLFVVVNSTKLQAFLVLLVIFLSSTIFVAAQERNGYFLNFVDRVSLEFYCGLARCHEQGIVNQNQSSGGGSNQGGNGDTEQIDEDKGSNGTGNSQIVDNRTIVQNITNNPVIERVIEKNTFKETQSLYLDEETVIELEGEIDDNYRKLRKLISGSTRDDDEQELTFNTGTNILSIENGNSVDLSILLGAVAASTTDELITSATYSTTTKELTIVDAGATYVLDLSSLSENITTLADNGDGTYTYTAEDGATTTIDTSAGDTLTSLVSAGSVISYVDENGATTSIDIANLETTTTLGFDGTNLTYVDEDGATTTLNIATIASSTDELITAVSFATSTNELTIVEGGVIRNVDLSTFGDLVVDGMLAVTGSLKDSDGDAGTAGQVLSTTATGTNWITPATFSDTDAQTITSSGTTIILSAGTGASTTVDIATLIFASTTDEFNTDLSFSSTTNTISSTDGGGVLTAIIDALSNITLLGTTVADILTANNIITTDFTATSATTTNLAVTGNTTLTGVTTGTSTDNIVLIDPATGEIKEISAATLIDDLETLTTVSASGSVITYTDEDGATTTIDIATLETLTTVVASGSVITYTDEDGNTTDIDIQDLETLTSIAQTVSSGNEIAVYSDEDGATTSLFETITTLATSTGAFTFTAEDGSTTTVAISDLETTTTLVNNNDGSFTYTNEDGATTTIDIKAEETTTTVSASGSVITYTDEDGNTTNIDIADLETTTTLSVNPASSTITYTNEDGTAVVANIADLETLTTVSLTGSVITYTDEDGVETDIDIKDAETTTTLTIAGQTFTYTDEDGATTTVDITDLETLTSLAQNADGTLTYTDEDGATTTVSAQTFVQASSTSDITVTGSGTLSDPYEVAFTESHTTFTNLIAGNQIASFTNENGDTFNIFETVTALSFTGTELSYIAEDGATTTLDLSSLSSSTDEYNTDLTFSSSTNTISSTDAGGTLSAIIDALTDISLLGTTIADILTANSITTTDLTATNATTTNLAVTGNTTLTGVTTGTSTDNIVLIDPATGELKEISAATLIDDLETLTTVSASGSVITYTDEDGATTTIDIATLETLTTVVASGSVITYTDEDGNTTDIDIQDLETLTSIAQTVSSGNEIAVYSDEDGATTSLFETITTLATSTGAFTFTAEDGSTTTVAISDLETTTTLVNNNDGSFTYTNEDGATTTIDIKAEETTTTVSASGSVITYTDEDGNTTDIDIQDLETLTSIAQTVSSGNEIAVYSDEDGATTSLFETITTLATSTGAFTFTAEDGSTTTVAISDLETTTTLVNNNDGSFTYTNEDGATTTIDIKAEETTTTVSASGSVITYTDEDGNTTNIDIADLETTTTLSVNPASSTITYTNEDGTAVVANIADLETLTTVSLSGSVITYTDEDGVETDIDIKDAETTTTLTIAGQTFTYTDEDGATTTVDITDLETLTSLAQNADGTLTYTDEDGATTTVSAQTFVQASSTSDITVTGSGTLSDPYEVAFTESHTTFTNLIAGNQIASFTNENGDTFNIFETVTALSFTGTELSYIAEDGATTTLDLSSLSSSTDEYNTDLTFSSSTNTISSTDAGGTLSAIIDALTDISLLGTTIADILTANSITTTDLTATNATTTNLAVTGNTTLTGVTTGTSTDNIVLIDPATGELKEISAATLIDDLETLTTVSASGSVITYTDEDGATTTIDIATLETLTTVVASGSVITYTDEDGNTTDIDIQDLETLTSIAQTVSSGNEIAVYSDEDGATTSLFETITTLATSTGAFTFTAEDGSTTTVAISDLETTTTLVNNNDGSFTYTNEDGATTTIDIKAEETTTTVSASGSVITYTDEDGNTTDIDIQDLETLTSIAQTVSSGNEIAVYSDEDGATTSLFETITTLATSTGAFTFTAEDGSTTTVAISDLETTTTLVNNNDGSFTYTNEDGATTTIDIKAEETTTTVSASGSVITYTDEDGNTTNIDIADLETTTTLSVNPASSTITYTNEDGTAVVANIADLETLTTVSLSGSVITYTDEDGVETDIDIKDAETTTTLTIAGQTFTYTDEDGATTTVDITDLETLTSLAQNADGTLTYTDEDGATTTVSAQTFVQASSTSDITVTGSGTLSDPYEVAFTEAHTTFTNLIAGNQIASFTNENGDTFNIFETVTALSFTGTELSYIAEDGATTTLDLSSLSSSTDEYNTDLTFSSSTNTISSTDAGGTLSAIIDALTDISLLGTTIADILTANSITTTDLTATNATTTNLAVTGNTTLTGVTTGTSTDNIVLIDPATGEIKEISAATLIDDLETLTTVSASGSVITYTDEDGATTTIDIATLETLTTVVASGSVITYTDEDGNTTDIDIQDLETLTSIAQTVSSGNEIAVYSDEDGATTSLFETITTLATSTGAFTFTAEDGSTTTVAISDLETTTTLVNNNDGSFTYTNEDGATTTIDIKAEETTTTVSASGSVITYTDEDGNTTNIDIADLETTTTLSVNPASSTITYTNEDGTAVVANIADLETLTTVSLTGSVITYTDEDGVETDIDIKDAETTTTLTIAGQTFTYTDEDGATTTVDITDLETLTSLAQNADGTLTYTDEDGATTTVSAQTFVQASSTSDITVTGSGTLADPYEVAFTEAHTTFTNLIAGNQIASFTNENGDTFNIFETVTALSFTGTELSYIAEDGATTTLDLSSLSSSTDEYNTDLTFSSSTNTISSTDAGGTLSAIIDALTDISLLGTTIADILTANSITTTDLTATNATTTNLAVTGNTTLTGVTTGTSTDNIVLIDPATGELKEISAATLIDDLETLTTVSASGSVITYTDEDGATTTIDIATLETLTTVVASGSVITYTDEDGNTTDIDIQDLETLTSIAQTVSSGNEIAVYSDEDGATTSLFETITTLATSTGAFTFTAEDGSTTTVAISDLETTTTLVNNNDGSFTYTNEDGATTTIDIKAEETTTTVSASGSVITYTDEDGNTTNIDIADLETTTTLSVNPASSTITYTNEDGTAVVANIADLETLTTVSLTGSVITYTDEDGVETDIDIKDAETTTTLTIAGQTFTYTDEDGATTTVDITDLETLTSLAQNADGTLTYTDEDGATTTVSAQTFVQASSTSDITVTGSGTLSDPYEVAFTEAHTTFTNLIAGNQIASFTNENGDTFNIFETVTALSFTGTELSYIAEDGATTTLDLSSLSSSTDEYNTDLTFSSSTNTISSTDAGGTLSAIIDALTDISLLGTTIADILTANSITTTDLTATNATTTNLAVTGNTTLTGVTTGTSTDNIVLIDPATGELKEISAATLIDDLETLTTVSASGSVITYTDEDGATTTIDIATLETLTTVVASGSVITYTDEDGNTTDIDIQDLETLTSIAQTVSSGNEIAVYSDEDGATTSLFETITTLATSTGAFTFTAEDGSTTTVAISDLETTTTLVNNNDGSFTYTNEDGATTTIDIKAEETTTTVSASGSVITYTDEDGNTTNIDIADLETTTTLSVNPASSTITYTNEDGTAVVANIADLETLTTVSLTGSVITYTDEDGVETDIDIKDAETTTTLTIAGQTFTYTDEDGATTTVDITDLETLTSLAQNADGTLTYTDEDGATTTVSAQTFVQASSTSDITVTGSGTLSDPYEVAFTEAHTTFTNLIAGNQIASFTNENGDTFNIFETVTALSFTGTELSYIAEDGATTTLDLSSLSSSTDEYNTDLTFSSSTNTISSTDAGGTLSAIIDALTDISLLGTTIADILTANSITTTDLTATNATTTNLTITAPGVGTSTDTILTRDASGVVREISASTLVTDLETVTSITTGTSTFTYTDEDGTDHTVDIKDLETVTSLSFDGTNLTYTDEDGATTTADLSVLSSSTDELNTLFSFATSTSLLSVTDAGGTLTVDLSSLVSTDDQNLTGAILTGTTLEIGIEDGASTTVDLASLSSSTDELIQSATFSTSTNELVITDAGNTFTLDLSSIASSTDELQTLAFATSTNILTISDGNTVDLTSLVSDPETTTTLVNNNDGTFTYTNEEGATTTIDIKAEETTTTVSASGSVITYTDEDGNTTTIDIADLETTTTLSVNPASSTITYTNEDGTAVVANIADLETLTTVSLTGSVITYTDEDGVETDVDIKDAETTTTLTVAGQTFTYTDEDGATTTVDITDLETLTSLAQNADGTLTYTDEDGATTTVSAQTFVQASSTSDITVTGSGTLSDPYEVAFTEAHTTFTNLIAGNQIASFTNENGDTFNIFETVTALSFTGTELSYIAEDGATTTLDLSSLSSSTDEYNTDLTFSSSTNTISSTDAGGTLSAIIDALTDISLLGTTIADILTANSITTTDLTATNATTTNLTITAPGVGTSTDTILTRDASGVVREISASTLVTDLETVTSITTGTSTFTYTDEDGTDHTVDIKDLETVTSLSFDGTNLTYTDEDGATTTADLSVLSSSTDELNTLFSFATSTSLLSVTDAGGTLTVDLSSLVSTDDQNLTGAILTGTTLEIGIEDGASTTVDLASLSSSTDELIQSATFSTSTNELVITDAGNTFTLDLSSIASSTDELQTLAFATSTNILTISDGNTVDLTSLVSDPETVTSLSFNAASGTLVYLDEDGATTTVDITSVGSCKILDGSVASPFTQLGMARTVDAAGIYYFDLDDDGTNDFSTYVDIDGYVQTAIDFGNGVGNLPQGTALSSSTRGILNTATLATLTDTTEVRISHSGGGVDVVNASSSIINRLIANETLHKGLADNIINDGWTGTNSIYLTGNAGCNTSFGSDLHENIVHVCLNANGMGWAPSDDKQRYHWNSGEITSTESLHLWAGAEEVAATSASCSEGSHNTELAFASSTNTISITDGDGTLTTIIDALTDISLLGTTVADILTANSITTTDLVATNATTTNLVITSPGTGTTTDTILTRDASGAVREISYSDLVVEPWFGTDDDAVATDNTEDIYSLGKVGIGIADPTYQLHVAGANSDASINSVRIGKGAGDIDSNTVLGNLALNSNTSGAFNTTMGQYSLFSNLTGSNNTAQGYASLFNNTGSFNTANGSSALYNNTAGSNNTAQGYAALYSNTTGTNNTAQGYASLYNTTGENNTALGNLAGYNITTGDNNIIIGSSINAPSATADNQLNIGNWIYGINGNIGIGTSTPSDRFVVSGDAHVTGAIKDSAGDVGTAGQVLSSTVTGTDWIDATGGDIVLSTTSSTTATTSNSGLELNGGVLSLLRGCDNGQGLEWDAATEEWTCGAGGTVIIENYYTQNASSSLAAGGLPTLSENEQTYLSDYGAMYLRAGKIFAWGYDVKGLGSATNVQSNVRWVHNIEPHAYYASTTYATEVTEVGYDPSFTEFVYSAENAYFLDHTGKVWAMGENDSRQLGIPQIPVGSNTTKPYIIDYFVDNGITITDLFMGSGLDTSHSVAAVSDDGTLYVWGENAAGQLGIGSVVDQATPVEVTTFSDEVVDVVFSGAGTTDVSTYVLLDTGEMYVAGDGALGKLGLGSTADQNTFVLSETNVAYVSASTNWAGIVKTDGKVYYAGDNFNGAFGDGDAVDHNTFIASASIPATTTVRKIVTAADQSTYNASYVIDEDDNLYVAGYNVYGNLGTKINTTADVTSFVLVPGDFQGNVQDVFVTGNQYLTAYILTKTGDVYVAGYNGDGQKGQGNTDMTNLYENTWHKIGFQESIEGVRAIGQNTTGTGAILVGRSGVIYYVGQTNNSANGQAVETTYPVIVNEPLIGVGSGSGGVISNLDFATSSNTLSITDSGGTLSVILDIFSDISLFGTTVADILTANSITTTNLTITAPGAGTTTDTVLTRNASGTVREISIANLSAANEPWFGTDDNAGATLNTENIYTLGNVGIGTTTPTVALTIEDTAAYIYLNDSNGVLQGSMNSGINLRASGVEHGFVGFPGTGVGNLYLRNQEGSILIDADTRNLHSNSYIALRVDGTEHMRVDDTGNVGIGTTTPTDKLSVEGNLYVTGSIRDSNGDVGTAGQILSTTATGTDWVDVTSSIMLSSTGTTTATSSNSGLEIVGGELSLLRGCNDGEVLQWNGTDEEWQCYQDNDYYQSSPDSDYVNNTATLSDVTDISFPIGADEEWYFSVDLQTDGDSQDDSRWTITCPAGATGDISVSNLETAVSQANIGCGQLSNQINSTNGTDQIILSGIIQNGATAGTVQIQARESNAVDAGNSLTIFESSILQAWRLSGADFAEVFFATQNDVIPGTIVSLDDSIEGGIQKATGSITKNAIGIVSTEPASVVGLRDFDGNGAPIAVALSGRVPVRVSNENGSIVSGDKITVSSSTPGIGMRATEASYTIGTAMNSMNSATGTVVVFVENHWFPGLNIVDNSDEFVTESDGSTVASGTVTGATLFWNGIEWVENTNVTIDVNGNATTTGFFATALEAASSIFGDTTVTGDTNLASTSIDNLFLGSLSSGTSTDQIIVRDSTTGEAKQIAVSDLTISGAIGSIFFAGSDGKATEDNNNFFWDDTNNRLGIGTTTPTEELTVEGDIRSTANIFAQTIELLSNSAAQFLISFDLANKTEFTVNAVGDLTIAPTGDHVLVPDNTLQVCESGACPAVLTGALSGVGNAVLENDLAIGGEIVDATGSVGATGQVLSPNGSGQMTWQSQAGGVPPYLASDQEKVGVSTTQTILLEGQYFTPNSAVSIPGFAGTVSSVNILGPTEIEVTLTTTAATGTYDIVISNPGGALNTQWTGNGVNTFIVYDVPAWTDLRSGGTTLSTGNGAGNDVRHRSGMTVNRDANGMYFSGSTPWSSWVKFESLGWNRGDDSTLEWIISQPTSYMMIGIGSDATNETNTAQYAQAEVEAYFNSSTAFWGLYGNNGTVGTAGNQNSGSTIGNNTYKLKFENDGTVGGTFTIYQLPSANQADWDDENTVIKTMTIGGSLNPNETNIMPFIVPQNGGTQRFLGLRVY